MSRRSHTLSKASKTNSEEDWIKYRITRNHVTSILRKAKCNYFRLLVESTRGNPKNLWSEFNKVLGKSSRSNITLLQSDDGDVTNQDDIAKSFSEHFSSIIGQHQQCDNSLYMDTVSVCASQFKFCDIKVEDTYSLLKNIDISKATGADGIALKC